MVMTQVLRTLTTLMLWLYTMLLSTWWGIQWLIGDTLWWVALIRSFTPLLFLPLLFFWPIGLWVRRPTYWLGILLPTTLFLALYGCLFLPRSTPPYAATSSTLRIMTFNLWGGSYREKTARVILENDLPDLVALQEVTPLMQRLLRRTISQYYPYIFFDSTIGGRGLGLLSRYPVERLPSDLLIDLSCRQYRVTVDVHHRFRLYNCHPYSTNILYAFGDLPAVIQRTGETFHLRTLLSQQLAQEIQANAEPTIVVGDFNTTDQSDAYHHLRTVLSDAHRTVGWGFGHTFPARTGFSRGIPILSRQVRIDMVLYTAEFVALQTQVSETYGESDHYPVLATLGWRRIGQ